MQNYTLNAGLDFLILAENMNSEIMRMLVWVNENGDQVLIQQCKSTKALIESIACKKMGDILNSNKTEAVKLAICKIISKLEDQVEELIRTSDLFNIKYNKIDDSNVVGYNEKVEVFETLTVILKKLIRKLLES